MGAVGATPAPAGVGSTGGTLEQATTSASIVPRIGAAASRLARAKALLMWVILLESLGALCLLLLIVWWTMFAGRRKGERRQDRDDGA